MREKWSPQMTSTVPHIALREPGATTRDGLDAAELGGNQHRLESTPKVGMATATPLVYTKPVPLNSTEVTQHAATKKKKEKGEVTQHAAKTTGRPCEPQSQLYQA